MRTLKDLPAPFIIADCGSNWCIGKDQAENLQMAKRHVFDAAACGASAVKFQLFTDKELYGLEGPNKYALPREWIPALAAYSASRNIEFMCSAFSEDGYRFIDPFVNIHKVASCEMMHVGILKTLASIQKPLLISTGAASEAELGLVRMHTQVVCGPMFMQCVADYPAPTADYNLNVFKTGSYIGLSDHTEGAGTALVALGLGATIFEKHFAAVECETPDYKTSLGPSDLRIYCEILRTAYASLGDGNKRTMASEQEIVRRHRRRLKVTQSIKAGERLGLGKNFGIYRSITVDLEAASPFHVEQFNNGVALRDLHPGDPVWTSTVRPNGSEASP